MKEEWKCPLCGYEGEVEIRNAYKNQSENTIGFAAEEYCPGCGTALARIPSVLEFNEKLERVVTDRRKEETKE